MTRIVLGTIAMDEMAGGLERNIALLANHLVEQGHDVHLLTFDRADARSFYPLDPRVTWHRVGRTTPHAAIGFGARLKLIAAMRSVISHHRGSIVICFHHGILFRFIAAAVGSGATLVCSERNSLRLYEHIRQSKWSFNFVLLALTRRITVQFASYVADYPVWLRRRIRVIPNPVYAAARRASPARPAADGRFRLVCVGRLCAQKNQRALVLAFAELASRFPDWDLELVGDGPARDDLRQTIDRFDLKRRVFLAGRSDEIEARLLAGHAFCLPSLWEGFPNALAEAMAHGLPAVAYESCPGAKDLVDHERTGLLAERDGLADCLGRLMAAPDMRMRIGAAAAAAMDRFSPESSFRKWQDLLAEVQQA
jgi:glycosyltransferase involved in cell wall biosynthesis